MAADFFPWPRGPLVWWPRARAVEPVAAADPGRDLPSLVMGEPPRLTGVDTDVDVEFGADDQAVQSRSRPA
jgi:hypothetical protein